MKNTIISLAFILPFFLNAQTLNIDQSSTFAVVVGISDYQDEGIPDLRFADKDAEAFANFLRSPAAGALDEDHLKVLINEQATVARFAIALDWLWEVVQENDKVVIYFSGHGDVERKSLTQPGFLLCWDAPAKVYMAGGTFALPMLQEVISTLSIQNKAKVVVITDACRSGKLSGSFVGGSQLTNSNLAKQYANEIKILSCQPDEYSIEGEQWGGGRGAFSYHLLEGLYGMADGNEDLSVNLKEIDRYLEDHVSEEVAPQSQNPMTIGSKTEKLADVFPEILAQIKEGKRGELQMFSPIYQRGIEDDVLAQTDSNIVEMYFAFKKSLEDKAFLGPENACADWYYELLIKEPALEKLHSGMRRNYAAALQDDAQQVLNLWLSTDHKELSVSKVNQSNKYQLYPRYLEKAAMLLGEEHYMYNVLQARKLYFEGYLMHIDDREADMDLGKKVLDKYYASLKRQPESPFVYYSMGMVYFQQMLQTDSAEYYMHKATSLAPSWFLPYSRLGWLYGDQYNMEKMKHFLELADQVDSIAAHTNLYHMNFWGQYYSFTGQFAEAEKQYKKMIQMDSTFFFAYSSLGLVYMNSEQVDLAETYIKKSFEWDSTDWAPHANLGMIYIETGRHAEAEIQFKKVAQLDPTGIVPLVGLTMTNIYLGRYSEAKAQFEKVMQQDSMYMRAYVNIGVAYFKKGMYEESETLFKKAIQLDSTYSSVYYNLACIKSLQGDIEPAFDYLEKTLINGLNNYNLMQQDTDLAPLRERKEQWKALMKKYFPEEVKE